jgi:hypothetical protein
MIFGTSKVWWILSGVLFLLGLVLMGTAQGSTLRTVLGLISLFAGVATFAAAPMRYGENARLSRKERKEREAAARAAAMASQPQSAPTNLPPAPPPPPRERPQIAGRDASEV